MTDDAAAKVKRFAANLRARRQAKKLSMSALSIAAGLTRGHVEQIEKLRVGAVEN